ncbi:unnamed protein product [Rotaria sordida]|uniref:DNA polymerase epsilon,catalytic subunit A thumb domain-containing protein n=1 Tax=Rotaria sordida TaxID=392033 RepID=A0A816FU21_9BILA|nr:unnamed protein product [Rotaria sordida]CAF1666051.1 unnamed protein product [Rotaria sordida]
MLSDYDEEKSTSISRTKRLIEFFSEDVIKDNDLCCRFVIANVSPKRKHDELNEKTLTRQWRIVLGPSSFFGQTNSQYIKWLNYQKRK